MKPNPETEIANRLRTELRQARDRLREDAAADPLVWPIPSSLACSQRALRDHPRFGGRGQHLPPEAGGEVVAWVSRVCALGVRAVICLMHPKELRYYDGLPDLPDGLLALYGSCGLEVRQLPWADPAHAKTPQARQALLNRVHEIKIEAYSAYKALPKPVLLHCSAGIDRTAPVAAYIMLAEGRATGKMGNEINREHR